MAMNFNPEQVRRTFKEIAEIMGERGFKMSKQRVIQIHDNALKKLKLKLEKEDDRQGRRPS
jgi:DNA-directed RNA polymerase specialized sigma subunit